MASRAHRWVIVLAAGDGTRLQSLTTQSAGLAIPKQYCSVGGTRSMLQNTLNRARLLVPDERIVVIVAAQHRQWWHRELVEFPPENVVVQPQNRGTGPGILLPLMLIHTRDPEAEVLLMPSDHSVDREDVLCSAEEQAFLEAREPGHPIVLLGITPREADSGYGWILPAETSPSRSSLTIPSHQSSPTTPDLAGYLAPGNEQGKNCGLAKVERFVEKPPVGEARELMAKGALVNAFLLTAQSRSFLHLYREHPALVGSFRSLVNDCGNLEIDGQALRKLYENLSTLDFSGHLLQSSPENLWVLQVPACGWTDLGTPERPERVRTSLSQKRKAQNRRCQSRRIQSKKEQNKKARGETVGDERRRLLKTVGPRAVLDLATVAEHPIPPDLSGLADSAAMARAVR